MGNRKSREFRLQQEQEAAWQRIRTESRLATRDVLAQGIGQLRMQLIECPSFEDPAAWEVRSGPEGWILYRPQVLDTEKWPDVELLGYDLVPFSSARLELYFKTVTALSLPISPDLSERGGLDGTLYQLAIFGDLYSSWRFHWWSEPPGQWQPLVDIATEMLAEFAAALRR